MNMLSSRVAIFAATFFLALISSSAQAIQMSFVTNNTELHHALIAAEKGVIGGVAIRQDFYLNSTEHNRHRVRKLIAAVDKLRDRPVYVYGPNLSEVFANSLVETRNVGCGPVVWKGKMYRSKYKHDLGVFFCTATSEFFDEEGFREQITKDATEREQERLKL